MLAVCFVIGTMWKDFHSSENSTSDDDGSNWSSLHSEVHSTFVYKYCIIHLGAVHKWRHRFWGVGD